MDCRPGPVALPSVTCCKAAEKSVCRRLSPAILLKLPGGMSEQHVAAHARQLDPGLSPLGPMRVTSAGPPGLVLSYARLAPRHCTEAVTRLKQAVNAVLAEERSLTAAAIPADSDQPWHLTSADWPAATEDFYSF
jgi:hypothetical protein